MGAMTSPITRLTVIYWTVYSGADQRKRQSSASLALVREFTSDPWIPTHMSSNAENISIWWRIMIIFCINDGCHCEDGEGWDHRLTDWGDDGYNNLVSLIHCGIAMPEADIKGRDKYSHPTIYMECNYLSLPLIPATGTTLLDCHAVTASRPTLLTTPCD